MTCIGRFAPSPTGDLHLGSLVAAVGSRLEALRQRGRWHLRIDDLDAPRVVPGAAERILATLTALGFEWATPVEYQSANAARYAGALAALDRAGLLFACACTRRTRAAAIAAAEAPDLPDEASCVSGCAARALPRDGHALRCRLEASAAQLSWHDRLQGAQAIVTQLPRDVIVQRRDGIIAYQLAVVVDDAAIGVTDVVRGADLIGSTVWQRGLQIALGLPLPGYAHLPVVVEPDGSKLAKSRRSLAIDALQPGRMLAQALTLLRHAPPDGLERGSTQALWDWARAHWQPERLAGLREVQAPH